MDLKRRRKRAIKQPVFFSPPQTQRETQTTRKSFHLLFTSSSFSFYSCDISETLSCSLESIRPSIHPSRSPPTGLSTKGKRGQTTKGGPFPWPHETNTWYSTFHYNRILRVSPKRIKFALILMLLTINALILSLLIQGRFVRINTSGTDCTCDTCDHQEWVFVSPSARVRSQMSHFFGRSGLVRWHQSEEEEEEVRA